MRPPPRDLLNKGFQERHTKMYLTAIHNRIRTAFETEYKLIFHSDDDVVNFVKQVCVLVKDNSSSMRLRDFGKHKNWANIVRRVLLLLERSSKREMFLPVCVYYKL